MRKFARDIRALNARFRKLKKQNGPMADRLAATKDALIDAMVAQCGHPEIIGTRGARRYGVMRMAFPPRRLCVACGHCESRTSNAPFRLLAGKKVALYSVDEYLVRQGVALKRLGINI